MTDDGALSVEELQRIGVAQTHGRFSRPSADAAFDRRYRRTLRRLVGNPQQPTVQFYLATIAPWRRRRGRPSHLELHGRRGRRCSLYRALAIIGAEVLGRQRRRTQSATDARANVQLNVDQIVRRYTTLKGRQRRQKIGEIFRAIGLQSATPETTRKQLTRAAHRLTGASK